MCEPDSSKTFPDGVLHLVGEGALSFIGKPFLFGSDGVRSDRIIEDLRADTFLDKFGTDFCLGDNLDEVILSLGSGFRIDFGLNGQLLKDTVTGNVKE